MKSVKSQLRLELKRRRRAYYASLSAEELANIEQRFIENLFSLPFFQVPHQIVSCYYAVGEEAPTSEMINVFWQRGFQVCLPCIYPDSSMRLHLYTRESALEYSAFKIPQPLQQSPICIPTILIVPLLAFDQQGHRIGYGKGHYDRVMQVFRRNNSPICVGLAFDCQEISEGFAEEFDERLDWVVTENRVLNTSDQCT
jgi:5-formyltetrahydrofolate cyclo-ligase